jgi:hypothetical protein
MNAVLPRYWLRWCLAGSRGQETVVEYVLAENRLLREQLGGRRLHLTDAQRRLLTDRANALGRGWEYTRIRGELYNLGHDLGRNTIERILVDAGIDPAQKRSKPNLGAFAGRLVLRESR